MGMALSQPPCLAQLSGDDMTRLKGMEEKLFFKSYDEVESIEARLSRIEKKVYGDNGEGSPQERLNRLKEVVKPDPPKPPQNNNAPQRKPPPVQNQADTSLESREEAQERMRRRAMMAKEEEVSQLQAEAVELWKARRDNEAQEKFEQVIRLAPDYAEAHFSLGVIQEAKQNFSEALLCYKRALDLNPRKREYSEAVALIEKKARTQEADRGQKQELKVLAEQASAAYRRGEFNSALTLYKELDRKAPKEALVKYNIATIYLALKNPVDALDYFKQALKLKPDEARYREAVEKLSANLSNSEKERAQAEAAWQDNQGGNGRKEKDPLGSGNMGGNLAGRGATPPSAAFGILVKGVSGAVEITTIGNASRASRAGLQKGDIIKAVDGVVTDNVNTFNQMLKRKQPNEGVQMIIQRGAKIGQFVL